MFQPLLLYKVGIAVEFATMLQASGPGEDAGNRVGAGRPSLKAKLSVSFLKCYIYMYTLYF